MSRIDECGICGIEFLLASPDGHLISQSHLWTSRALLDRQRRAHYGQECDLGYAVLHKPSLCPVCQTEETHCALA